MKSQQRTKLNPTKPKRLLTCLAIGLWSTVTQAQTPIELTSITSTTNGVRLAWTDPGPGQAYTVQVRESLTSGAWRNGAMRYRWPWPAFSWQRHRSQLEQSGLRPPGCPTVTVTDTAVPDATSPYTNDAHYSCRVRQP